MNKFYDLSPREKTLLYILLIVAIVSVSIYLLLVPTGDKHAVLKTTLADEQYKEQEMRMIIESRPAIEKSIANTNKQIQAYENKLYPLMTNEEIDKVVTTMFLKNNLKPLDLRLVDTSAQDIPAFLAAEDSAKPTLISNMMKAQLEVKNLRDFAAMASGIGKNPSMRVLDFTTAYKSNGLYTVEISFIIYMVDKTNHSPAPVSDLKEVVDENAKQATQTQ